MEIITNLNDVLTLNVNASEIENSILEGEQYFFNLDFFFVFTTVASTYQVGENEVLLHTDKRSVLVRKQSKKPDHVVEVNGMVKPATKK